jgi:hypothetical protein
MRIRPAHRALILVFLLVAMGGCRGAGGFAHDRFTVLFPDAPAGLPAGEGGALARVEIRPDRPFTELILSFNAEIAGGGLIAEVRVPAGGEGAWLRIAEWGAESVSGVGDGVFTRAPGVRVAIDELLADSPLSSAEVRLVAHGAQAVRPVRLDITTTRPVPDGPGSSPGPRIELPVPFYSQSTEDPERAGRLCSPTSLAMLMAHRVGRVDPVRVADACFDPRHDLFGVWPRNIQAAASMGVPGYLARFSDWDEVRRHLGGVGPIAISITARGGEVGNMTYDPGGGHLLVLIGLTESGDAIVLDPAYKDEADARRVYPERDLTEVWLRRKRGTAYVLLPPD